MIYKTLESLEPITKFLKSVNKITETKESVKDTDPYLKEILGAAAGAGIGAAGSFGALGALGVAGYSAAGITSGLAAAGSVVGGGMLAGIGVLAAPVAILGVGGYALISSKKKKELICKKEALLNDAIRKQNVIIEMLKQKINLTEEKIKELENTNIYLDKIIESLRGDISEK